MKKSKFMRRGFAPIVTVLRVDHIAGGISGDLTDIIFLKGNLIYQITMEPGTQDNLSEFDQILSTFKFLN